MRRCLVALFAFGVGACAHDEARPQSGPCSIAEPKWASWENDFDKTLNQDTLEKLNQVIRADRDSFHADPTGRSIGPKLDQLNGSLTMGSHFVSHQAQVTATRLRQLECAIQRGTYSGRVDTADHLFSDILGDVDNQIRVAKAQ
jgi:hypothetical protein